MAMMAGMCDVGVLVLPFSRGDRRELVCLLSLTGPSVGGCSFERVRGSAITTERSLGAFEGSKCNWTLGANRPDGSAINTDPCLKPTRELCD